MNTTPYFKEGYLAAASIDNPGATEPSRIVDRQLLRLWQYRRMLRSPLIQPFRQALRPLVRWLFTNHLFVRDPDEQGHRIGVNLKPLSIATAVLCLLLAPLVVAMLLPLILVLLPVAMVFGMIGLASTAVQTDADDIQHHSMVWHLMH